MESMTGIGAYEKVNMLNFFFIELVECFLTSFWDNFLTLKGAPYSNFGEFKQYLGKFLKDILNPDGFLLFLENFQVSETLMEGFVAKLLV